MSLPYVVGPWVRGERFYGRSGLLREVLEGRRDRLRLVATRRIGKTSLLREAERLAGRMPDGFLPVVWDLQGSDEPEELDLGLHEALADSEPALEAAGLPLPAPGPAAETVAGLAAALHRRGRRLLLLCDEAEELFSLLSRRPELVGPLGDAWTTGGARVVLASSARLAAAPGEPAARLLADFGPPETLGPLDDSDARALLRQEKLPAARRPPLADGALDLLASRCGGHPFLLQLAGRRTIELGDASAACAGLACDPTVTHLCEVDLALLEESDRELLHSLAAPSPRRRGPDEEALSRLRKLGLVRTGAGSRPEPGSWFLERHLAASARPRS